MNHRNLTMTRGDTLQFEVTVLQGVVPENLTGGRLVLVAKHDPLDANEVFKVSTDMGGADGIALTNPAQGVATVTIPPAATAALPELRTHLVYALKYTSAGGFEATLLRGKIFVLPEITNGF